MSSVFPLGFPGPTAFYLAVYVLTFVLHQVFMHYVLAGSLYTAWATVWPGRGLKPRIEQPLGATVRDWMPFLLSAAITAGVAPLLFIQIVYQHQFYTANLLLWWKWMLVVPVLIEAFYVLYLVKSSTLWRWPYFVRVAVVLLNASSFVFVGFCWTVNHLLANSRANWPEVYATGQLPFAAATIVPRMLVWIGGSFATMSAIVGWQHFYRQEVVIESPMAGQGPDRNDFGAVRTLAKLTCGGLSVAFVAAVIYVSTADPESKQIVFGSMIFPYVCLAMAGAVLQGFGWTSLWRANRFTIFGLSLVTCGASLGILGVSVVREGFRVSAIDLASLAQRHSEAAKVGGFGVFLMATVIVVVTMTWCVRLVQKGSCIDANDSSSHA